MEDYFKVKELKSNISQLKEIKSGMINFLSSSKRSVKSILIYKSFVIILTDDDLILIFSLQEERVTMEITDFKEAEICQLDILYEIPNFIYCDLLLILTKYKLYFYNLNTYSSLLKIDFKQTCLSVSVSYEHECPVILVKNIKGFTLVKLFENLSFSKTIEIDDLDLEDNFQSLIGRNFVLLDTKSKLLIYKFKIFPNPLNDFDNTKDELYNIIISVQNDDFSDLNDYKQLLYNNKITSESNKKIKKFETQWKVIKIDKNKSSYFKPDLKFAEIKGGTIYTKVCQSLAYESLYLGILNKIISIKNTFSEYLGEEFNVVQKASKVTVILEIKISDPYIYLLTDMKVIIHFLYDLEKAIEILDFSNNFIGFHNFSNYYYLCFLSQFFSFVLLQIYSNFC